MKTQHEQHKYLGKHSEPDETEIVKEYKNTFYDSHGKKYIDFVVGWCVGNFGWNNPEIKKRIQKFHGPDYVPPHHMYKPWDELAHRLESIAPGNLKKSFRATGGTEAVDLALSAAMIFTHRTKFISVEHAYHGNSVAARCIGATGYGDYFENPFSAYRMKPSFDSHCLEETEKALATRDVAALIMEPIVLNKGVLIPPEEFMKELQSLCVKYGTLFIADEVATGFGRTGKLFASEHYDLKPDIMCLGKAITGGYAPMGATMMTEEVAKAMEKDDIFYSTYGWHPLSVEAALGTLDYIDKHWDVLEVNVRELGNYIVEQLSLMEFKEEPRIRHKGFAFNVQFDGSDTYGKEVVENAYKHGLILAQNGKGFSMFPALNIDRHTVDEALNILINSL